MANTEIPQPTAAPQPGPPGPPPAQGSNGLATAGFVLGLLGLLGSWIPLLNILGILLGAIGVVLAGVGLAKSKRAGAGRGLSIAGIVLGGLAVVFAIVVNVAFVGAVDEAIDDAIDETSTSSGANGTGGKSNELDEAEDASSFVDGVLTTPDVKIVITDNKVIPVGAKGNEYGDKPVIAFWYEITNLSGEKIDPMEWLFLISAYQDNNPNAENELEVGSLPDDRFLDTQMETIKKGGTVENAMAYELDDEVTPVDLVASDMLGMDEYGTVTYDVK
ncbi:DUF5067 domain-containing protein [Nocardioides sp. GY 10113]|uniref:DUF5067 domain-containing protein n=1 Tax=Nocardioides sp. GY 10113 TaxID=2569761 RepID=UPI0010A8F92E|nr:DUF5067 domain-containing protein [Nocardioides sp. GY 10113]TIC89109.1 DUF5067 domain-containing protein [Nocardioides sp. GY 10113]